MAAMSTPRRMDGRKPLRPVTPMGQDLPEDTPSKIRVRNAMECRGIRQRLEEEAAQAEAETGLAAHEQFLEDRTRKAALAKADASLRRDLLARQAEHKRLTHEQETERERRERSEESEERKTADALKELRRLERDAERREQRQSRAEMVSRTKENKAVEEAQQRSLVAREYEAALAERQRKEAEMKAARKADVEARKLGILEARQRRAEERAAAAAVLRVQLEQSKEASRVAGARQRAAADQHRQLLRSRAESYRKDKELAKTSAYAR